MQGYSTLGLKKREQRGELQPTTAKPVLARQGDAEGGGQNEHWENFPRVGSVLGSDNLGVPRNVFNRLTATWNSKPSPLSYRRCKLTQERLDIIGQMSLSAGCPNADFVISGQAMTSTITKGSPDLGLFYTNPCFTARIQSLKPGQGLRMPSSAPGTVH